MQDNAKEYVALIQEEMRLQQRLHEIQIELKGQKSSQQDLIETVNRLKHCLGSLQGMGYTPARQ